jgi:hypothetical protein
MGANIKVVTQLPLTELWCVEGFATNSRVRELAAEDIACLLSVGRVQFVVADLGASPRWIPLGECYDFWKTELRPHLAASESGAYLNDYPDEYF